MNIVDVFDELGFIGATDLSEWRFWKYLKHLMSGVIMNFGTLDDTDNISVRVCSVTCSCRFNKKFRCVKNDNLWVFFLKFF